MKPELPVIPKEVADWIEKCKLAGNDIWQFLSQADVAEGDYGEEWAKWISAHADTFARAWLDGYQLEEDK